METLSARAKEELARVVPNNGYDARAELSAIVSCAGSVNISHGGMTVSVATDNRDMPALVSKLSLMLMMPIPRAEFAKHITLTFDGGREVLEKLLIFRGGDRPGKVEGIDALLVRGDSEKRAYVRGAFLGAGFLSAGRNNHMEFAFSGEKQRDDVLALFPEGLTPGAGRRGGRYTAYFKSKSSTNRFSRIDTGNCYNVFPGYKKGSDIEYLISFIKNIRTFRNRSHKVSIDKNLGIACRHDKQDCTLRKRVQRKRPTEQVV